MDELGRHQAYHTYDTFKQKVISEGTRVNGRVCFEYVSSDGVSRRRVVDVQAFLRNREGHYSVGYCHLRHDLRTFHSQSAVRLWDVLSSCWYTDLRSWCLVAAMGPEVLLPTLSLGQMTELTAMNWDTESFHAAEADQARRDLDMVERMAVKADWETTRIGPTFEGQQGLLFNRPKQRTREVAVYYLPRASLLAARAKEGAPAWTWELKPWRIVPKRQFTKAYPSIWKVVASLQNRQILPTVRPD